MISSVVITNQLGESIELELRFPEKSGFLIRSIDGLGPVKTNINTTELATRDGAIFNSARLNSRNIVFDLVFVPNYQLLETVEDVRLRSYKYFSIKEKVEVKVNTDRRTAKIDGYIESNDVDIFSKEESTQISIICPTSYFTALGPQVFNFSSSVPLFEFPFSNESLNVPLLELSELVINTLTNIFYDGDLETGLVFSIHATGPVENLSIVNENSSGTIKIDTDLLTILTGDGIIAGDDITISTVKGSKYAILLRDGVYINILNSIAQFPEWFSLSKKDNVFGFIADSGIENLQFKISYVSLYEGV